MLETRDPYKEVIEKGIELARFHCSGDEAF